MMQGKGLSFFYANSAEPTPTPTHQHTTQMMQRRTTTTTTNSSGSFLRRGGSPSLSPAIPQSSLPPFLTHHVVSCLVLLALRPCAWGKSSPSATALRCCYFVAGSCAKTACKLHPGFHLPALVHPPLDLPIARFPAPAVPGASLLHMCALSLLHALWLVAVRAAVFYSSLVEPLPRDCRPALNKSRENMLVSILPCVATNHSYIHCVSRGRPLFPRQSSSLPSFSSPRHPLPTASQDHDHHDGQQSTIAPPPSFIHLLHRHGENDNEEERQQQ